METVFNKQKGKRSKFKFKDYRHLVAGKITFFFQISLSLGCRF